MKNFWKSLVLLVVLLSFTCVYANPTKVLTTNELTALKNETNLSNSTEISKEKAKVVQIAEPSEKKVETVVVFPENSSQKSNDAREDLETGEPHQVKTVHVLKEKKEKEQEKLNDVKVEASITVKDSSKENKSSVAEVIPEKIAQKKPESFSIEILKEEKDKTLVNPGMKDPKEELDKLVYTLYSIDPPSVFGPVILEPKHTTKPSIWAEIAACPGCSFRMHPIFGGSDVRHGYNKNTFIPQYMQRSKVKVEDQKFDPNEDDQFDFSLRNLQKMRLNAWRTKKMFPNLYNNINFKETFPNPDDLLTPGESADRARFSWPSWNFWPFGGSKEVVTKPPVKDHDIIILPPKPKPSSATVPILIPASVPLVKTSPNKIPPNNDKLPQVPPSNVIPPNNTTPPNNGPPSSTQPDNIPPSSNAPPPNTVPPPNSTPPLNNALPADTPPPNKVVGQTEPLPAAGRSYYFHSNTEPMFNNFNGDTFRSELSRPKMPPLGTDLTRPPLPPNQQPPPPPPGFKCPFMEKFRR